MVIRDASAFLFDLDGTLVDSSRLHCRAFRVALAEFAPHLSASFDYDDVRGLTTEDALESIGVDAAHIAAVSLVKRQTYRALVAGGALQVVQGAAATLERCVRRHQKLAVVTSGSKASAQTALTATGLDQYFEVAVFGDDVTRAKPDPEPYALACKRLDISPGTAVVVEDAISGVLAGRAAGCSVIGVNNGELRDQVDAYFSTLAELGEAVSQS